MSKAKGRRRVGLLVVALLLLGCAVAIIPPDQADATQPSHLKARGQVVAVNVQDIPNVIVVKSLTAKKREMIVGAIVDADVKIMRGNRHVSLENIKIGESVDLVYVKTPEGLVARSIRIR